MKISPSILNANFLDLENEISKISTADYLHLDVMDGNFVPNISFGPYISKQAASSSSLLVDIHLMINDPMKYIDQFVFPNTYVITIHCETEEPLKTLQYIRKRNINAGISLRPSTDLEALKPLLPYCDLILVMSVEPGFGGQKFIPETKERIQKLVQWREENSYAYQIEVDGGINDETILEVEEADICVVGSYLFSNPDIKEAIKNLQKSNLGRKKEVILQAIPENDNIKKID